MKTNRLFWMAGALCAALGLGSCSNEMDEVAAPAEGATRTVTLTVSLPGGGADTRTVYTPDGADLKVTWAKGDKLTAVSDDTWNFTKSTTFTLLSGAGTDTATFTGDIPADVDEGDDVIFYYPEVQKEGDYYLLVDYTQQTGKLEGLGSVDVFAFAATYQDGTFNTIKEAELRPSTFLHFAKGTAIGTGSTADFKLSGVSSKFFWDNSEKDGIAISDVALDSEGKLADDLYIAFLVFDVWLNNPTLTITVGSEKKVYSLDKELEGGTMYNINSLSQLTEVVTP